MGTGSPPRFVYEIEPRTATAVGTAEETPGFDAPAVLKVAATASGQPVAVPLLIGPHQVRDRGPHPVTRE
jgi:hypothetical protein